MINAGRPNGALQIPRFPGFPVENCVFEKRGTAVSGQVLLKKRESGVGAACAAGGENGCAFLLSK